MDQSRTQNLPQAKISMQKRSAPPPPPSQQQQQQQLTIASEGAGSKPQMQAREQQTGRSSSAASTAVRSFQALPVISVPYKNTQSVDWQHSLEKVLRNHFLEDPADFIPDIARLQSKRRLMMTTFGSSQGSELMLDYFRSLTGIEERFFKDGKCGDLTFTWRDAFSGKSTSSRDIAAEKASVLFNMAALHSLIASNNANKIENESWATVDPRVLQDLADRNQLAAGFLASIIQTFEPFTGDDLSPKVLKALQAMFLAQAQESLYYQRVREGYENLPGEVAAVSDKFSSAKRHADAAAGELPKLLYTQIHMKAHLFRVEEHFVALHYEAIAEPTFSKRTIAQRLWCCRRYLQRATATLKDMDRTVQLQYAGIVGQVRTATSLAAKRFKIDRSSSMESSPPPVYRAAKILSPLRSRLRADPSELLFQRLGNARFFNMHHTFSRRRTIRLTRDSKTGSFGLDISGDAPVFIVAHKCSHSELHEGDVILEINDVNLRDASQIEIADILKQQAISVIITVEAASGLDKHKKAAADTLAAAAAPLSAKTLAASKATAPAAAPAAAAAVAVATTTTAAAAAAAPAIAAPASVPATETVAETAAAVATAPATTTTATTTTMPLSSLDASMHPAPAAATADADAALVTGKTASLPPRSPQGPSVAAVAPTAAAPLTVAPMPVSAAPTHSDRAYDLLASKLRGVPSRPPLPVLWFTPSAETASSAPASAAAVLSAAAAPVAAVPLAVSSQAGTPSSIANSPASSGNIASNGLALNTVVSQSKVNSLISNFSNNGAARGNNTPRSNNVISSNSNTLTGSENNSGSNSNSAPLPSPLSKVEGAAAAAATAAAAAAAGTTAAPLPPPPPPLAPEISSALPYGSSSSPFVDAYLPPLDRAATWEQAPLESMPHMALSAERGAWPSLQKAATAGSAGAGKLSADLNGKRRFGIFGALGRPGAMSANNSSGDADDFHQHLALFDTRNSSSGGDGSSGGSNNNKRDSYGETASTGSEGAQKDSDNNAVSKKKAAKDEAKKQKKQKKKAAKAKAEGSGGDGGDGGPPLRYPKASLRRNWLNLRRPAAPAKRGFAASAAAGLSGMFGSGGSGRGGAGGGGSRGMGSTFGSNPFGDGDARINPLYLPESEAEFAFLHNPRL